MPDGGDGRAGEDGAPRARDLTLQHVLPEICRIRGVDTPEGLEAVHRAYNVTFNTVAPFIVHHMADFVHQAEAEIRDDPNHRYMFLGRDGNALAVSAAVLSPDLYAHHGAALSITRRMMENSLREQERVTGKSFEIDAFRKYKNDDIDEPVTGAKADLADVLESGGFQINEPGQTITVVDTSLKGSTQVGLSTQYPQPNWRGVYLVFMQGQTDPDPDSKKGLALDLRWPHDRGGAGEDELPASRAHTFAHPSAILIIEDLLHGPWSSAQGIDADGHPIQTLEPPPIDELNPLDISPAFQAPSTRLAAADAMLLAVRDRAFEAVRRRAAGADWRTELEQEAERFVDDVRSWISTGDTDPGLAELIRSFARPIDRHHISVLHNALRASRLSPSEIDAVWRGYSDMGTLADKQRYVTEYTLSRNQLEQE
ncbi:hypothetical protein NWFMUON74_40070 [Nocardia wallacei]|uniref:Uncharacterized protein n=1 Tax=Nocardia wallacei TaxID=480035 RepID=A0A7G1KLX2_9NOCA|nr:hypothetical protein NWFMUON74_40070 [Nocardia wallacei]